LFLSPTFFIEIQDGKVLLYLHNVEYNSDKINTAVSIIDNLSTKLSDINDSEEENGFSINKELLEKINLELQNFLIQKETICNNIKDFNKKLLPDLDKLAFPTLSIYLNAKYASAQNSSYCCKICGSFWTSKRGLAGHMKSHKEQEQQKKKINLQLFLLKQIKLESGRHIQNVDNLFTYILNTILKKQNLNITEYFTIYGVDFKNLINNFLCAYPKELKIKSQKSTQKYTPY